MRTLIVEDEFNSRNLMTKFLNPLGPTDVATDGFEATSAFKQAHDENEPYDLICLDIMMPNKDGYETLKEIREIEKELGIRGLDGVKIIMTTAVDSKQSILNTFRQGCESYIIKPIGKNKLYDELQQLELLTPQSSTQP